jgi:hypothetical protein
MDSKHTPTPWGTVKGPGARIRIVGPSREQIGEYYNQDADAKFGDRAVNNHEALLAALEEVARYKNFLPNSVDVKVSAAIEAAKEKITLWFEPMGEPGTGKTTGCGCSE